MPRRSSRHNPLGESSDLNSSSFEEPETDNNATRYSTRNTPQRPKPNTGPAFRNRSSHSVRDMELTRGANRTARVSEGPNRSPGRVRKLPKPRKIPFSRVVRETMQTYGNNLRITPQALLTIQEASKIYLAQFFEDSLRMTLHAKRVTLMPDMQLMNYLRGAWNML